MEGGEKDLLLLLRQAGLYPLAKPGLVVFRTDDQEFLTQLFGRAAQLVQLARSLAVPGRGFHRI